MTYAALREGASSEDAVKDLDYALEAPPGAPATRQKGARSLMGMLAAPPGRERR